MTKVENTALAIKKYISLNLPKTVRCNQTDDGSLIGLPKPYSVPCTSDTFQEMYYWDTYFTNKGFIAENNLLQPINNTENIAFLIEKYGYMPNGNRFNYLINSQPPFFSLMVGDCFDKTEDIKWLENMFQPLEAEYNFWQNKRILKIGLNGYSCVSLPNPTAFAEFYKSRTGFRPDGRTDEQLGLASIAACESGWDMNPRTSWKTNEYAAVDLNSLLYAMEIGLSHFAEILGKKDKAEFYLKQADTRAELCRKYMLNSDNLFFDYNVIEQKSGEVFSAASYYPLYCKMASREEAQAAKAALCRLETDYGILTCEKNTVPGNYQWDYPNGWAPLQLIVAAGLKNYGFEEDAMRIARKFTNLVEKCFEETGDMWEKYNVVTGTADAKSEYETPTMLGWTFGVYTEFKHWFNV